MKANIFPLEGKYYGTIIGIEDDLGNTYEIKLWNNGNYEPSDRELDGICTIEEWRADVRLPEKNDWWPEGIPAKEAVEICDSHFESRETYELAKKIVDLINNSK